MWQGAEEQMEARALARSATHQAATSGFVEALGLSQPPQSLVALGPQPPLEASGAEAGGPHPILGSREGWVWAGALFYRACVDVSVR